MVTQMQMEALGEKFAIVFCIVLGLALGYKFFKYLKAQGEVKKKRGKGRD